MKVAFTLIALALPSIVGAVMPQTDTGKAQLRAALTSMNEAASAVDVDRFMAWYAHEPSLAITFDGHTMHGWGSIRDQQSRWWSGAKSKPTYREDRPPEISLQSSDVATTLQWMTVSDGSPRGEAKPAHLVVTSVWKRRPEGWRIVIAHESLSQ